MFQSWPNSLDISAVSAGDTVTWHVDVAQTETQAGDKPKSEYFTLEYVSAGLLVVLPIVFSVLQWQTRVRTLKDNRVLKASEYFTGGSQSRSVGISMIEGMITSPRYVGVLIPMLYYQLVYLLIAANPTSKEGKIKGSRLHEVKNLHRILDLLCAFLKNQKGLKKLYFWLDSRQSYLKKEQFWVSWILINLERRIELNREPENKEDIGKRRSYLELNDVILFDWKRELQRINLLGKKSSRKLDIDLVQEHDTYRHHLICKGNGEVIFRSRSFMEISDCLEDLEVLVKEFGKVPKQSTKNRIVVFAEGENQVCDDQQTNLNFTERINRLYSNVRNLVKKVDQQTESKFKGPYHLRLLGAEPKEMVRSIQYFDLDIIQQRKALFDVEGLKGLDKSVEKFSAIVRKNADPDVSK